MDICCCLRTLFDFVFAFRAPVFRTKVCVCARGAVKGPPFIHTANLRVISSKDKQIKAPPPVWGHFIKPCSPQSGHKQSKGQLSSDPPSKAFQRLEK